MAAWLDDFMPLRRYGVTALRREDWLAITIILAS